MPFSGETHHCTIHQLAMTIKPLTVKVYNSDQDTSAQLQFYLHCFRISEEESELT